MIERDGLAFSLRWIIMEIEKLISDEAKVLIDTHWYQMIKRGKLPIRTNDDRHHRHHHRATIVEKMPSVENAGIEKFN